MLISIPQRDLFHWRRTRRGKKEVAICRRITIATVLGFGISASVAAAPSGGVVTSGTGDISQAGAVTEITQSSQRLDIDWNGFSIATGETVNFVQPNNLAVAINRVIGGVPSELSGALNANGRVFILNQAGVVFHQSAQVNVGSLLATTASDADVSALIDGEQYNFSHAIAGSVINHGNISISNGGFAILAAPQVQNTGMIQADLGEIHLAATTAYTLDLRGDGLINFAISAEAAHNVVGGVQAGGTLRAHAGLVSLDAHTASEVVNGVVNLDGVIDADALVSGGQGGRVILAATGDVTMSQYAAIHVDNGATGEIALSAGGNIGAGNLGINVSGMGDISAKVSAQAGGYLNVRQVNVSALSNHLAAARIDLQAGGDITVSNGLTATALASTDNNKAPYSVADIAVYSDHGGITITGDTLAISSVNGRDGAYEFGTAEAHTNVNVSAAQALTTHGNVTLRTDAYFGGERGDSESHTNLGLHSRDSGDITINGDIAIDNLATRNVYRSAEAVINADVSAANNLVINGGLSMKNTALAIAVGRSGHYTDGACMASTDTTLNMRAGTAGRGDLIITNGLNLDGYAKLHFGGTHSANAFVTADLKAANDIVISGASDAITLSAVGHNTAQSATNAFAYIDLDMTAGTSGAGSVRVNGDLTANADAYMKDGKFLNGAATVVNIQSPDDIAISGNVSLTTLLDATNRRRYSRAESLFLATAGLDGSGQLTISGDTYLSVEATTAGTIEAHTTTALVQLTAPGDIQLGGLTISALGDYSPAAGSAADVDANLAINSWGDGDITLNGDLLVTADAVQRVANKSDANAWAHLTAARHLTVNGDVTVSAAALSDAGAGDALSSADMVMHAGVGGGGNLHVTGDIESLAAAQAETGVQSAVAAITLAAADNLTVHGADPLARAAPAFVQGRATMSDDQLLDGGTHLASLSLSAGGTSSVDIPPPAPEPEPIVENTLDPSPEPLSENNSQTISTVQAPAVVPAEAASPSEGIGADTRSGLGQPDVPAAPTDRGNAKVSVSVISAFNSTPGPRSHDVSVSTQAVEHGALGGGSTSPLDNVVFEIDWDNVEATGKTLGPVSTLRAPLGDEGLAADKGERKRR